MVGGRSIASGSGKSDDEIKAEKIIESIKTLIANNNSIPIEFLLELSHISDYEIKAEKIVEAIKILIANNNSIPTEFLLELSYIKDKFVYYFLRKKINDILDNFLIELKDEKDLDKSKLFIDQEFKKTKEYKDSKEIISLLTEFSSANKSKNIIPETASSKG